jgi:hypothetical protein
MHPPKIFTAFLYFLKKVLSIFNSFGAWPRNIADVYDPLLSASVSLLTIRCATGFGALNAACHGGPCGRNLKSSRQNRLPPFNWRLPSTKTIRPSILYLAELAPYTSLYGSFVSQNRSN